MKLFARCMYALTLTVATLGGLRAEPSGEEPRDETEEGRERRRTGRRGELLAYWYLRRAGYQIIRRNFRAATGGEVDLIGWDGPVLAFIEVKTRTTSSGNEPEAAVHSAKREALRRAARAYLKRRGWPDVKYRFDVLALEAKGRARAPVVRLYKAAFGA